MPKCVGRQQSALIAGGANRTWSCIRRSRFREINASFIHPWWDQFWTHKDVKNLKNSGKGYKDGYGGRADDLQGEGYGAELVCPARGDTGMV